MKEKNMSQLHQHISDSVQVLLQLHPSLLPVTTLNLKVSSLTKSPAGSLKLQIDMIHVTFTSPLTTSLTYIPPRHSQRERAA